MSPAVVTLNVRLGSWGTHHRTASRSARPAEWKKSAPVTRTLGGRRTGSIRVLLIDESAPGEYLPWETIAPKLVREDAVVVAFAWSQAADTAVCARSCCPTAVYPEVDGRYAARGRFDGRRRFRLTAPLADGARTVCRQSGGVRRGARRDRRLGDPLRERAEAIHKHAGAGDAMPKASTNSGNRSTKAASGRSRGDCANAGRSQPRRIAEPTPTAVTMPSCRSPL